MARLKDIPFAVREVGPWTLLKGIVRQINEDNLLTWAAALAFSWLFALFPFMIFLLALLPLMPDNFSQRAQSSIVEGIESTLVGDAGEQVKREIERLLNEPRGGLLSIGLLFAIWAASSGMNFTMAALDQAYDIRQGRSFIKKRLVAITLTVWCAALVVCVIVLIPVGTAVVHWLDRNELLIGGTRWALNLARYTLGLLLLFGLLAIIYNFGPSFRRKFHLISPGSMFVVGCWFLIGWGFRAYLYQFGGSESYSATYGALGGVAIMLVVFYVYALVLLIGAEINSEIDFARLRIPHGQARDTATISTVHGDLDEEERELAEQLNRMRRPPQPAKSSPDPVS